MRVVMPSMRWVALLLLVAFSVTAPASAATKVEMYDEMIALANEMLALKPLVGGNTQAAADYAAKRARYQEISRQMGGDDPGAQLPNDNPAQNPPVSIEGTVPTAPPNCLGTTTVFTQSTPTAIPTGPAVVTSSVIVAGAGPYLWDLNLTTFLTHTFAADLDITIGSPAGTVVTLTTDNGAGNDNTFNGTVWDDDANPAGQVPYTTNNGMATDHAYVNLTLASPLVPEEDFAAFLGEDPNGTWTITISDDLAGDGGSLASWSLELTTFPAAPTLTTTSVTQSTPTAIPTGPAVVSSTAIIGGAGAAICGVRLATTLTHTFAADLDWTLLSPAASIATLSTDNGAGNDNVWNGTLWSADANPLGQVPYTTNNGVVTDHAYVNLTLASPLTVEESFGTFFGEDPNGTWTITISDDLAGDGGSLASWTLDVDTCSCVINVDHSATKTDGLTNAFPGQAVTYTITVANAGPQADPAAIITDTFPAGLTGVTWTCASGGGGGVCGNPNGAGNINETANLPAGGSVVFTVNATVGAAFVGTITNTATVAASVGVTDTAPGNNSGVDNTTVTSPADVTGTKTVDGIFEEGGAITYTVTLTNNGPATQLDNAGDEFIDVLPVGVSLVSATATSGTAVANIGLNTVTWNGSIPFPGSVTITIDATIDPGTGGQTLVNQGTINFDADGNASNESSGVTDDPAAGGATDGTGFIVGQDTVEIPTLSGISLALLALLLAIAASILLRRRA